MGSQVCGALRTVDPITRRQLHLSSDRYFGRWAADGSNFVTRTAPTTWNCRSSSTQYIESVYQKGLHKMETTAEKLNKRPITTAELRSRHTNHSSRSRLRFLISPCCRYRPRSPREPQAGSSPGIAWNLLRTLIDARPLWNFGQAVTKSFPFPYGYV
jgi:hypothetical protein